MRKSIHSDEQQVLVELLKQAREETGLTQVELAERLDEPQPFVSRYEAGERRLDLVELREICRALGIRLRQLVDDFEERVERQRGRDGS